MTARVLCTLLLLATAELFAQSAGTVDTVFLNDTAGSRRTGKIVGIEGGTLKLEVPLAVDSTAKATVTVPIAEIDRIEFAPSESRDQLLADPAAPAAPLGAEWNKWKPFLALPRSPAPAIGNAYAAALLRASGQAPEAFEIYTLIENESWSPEEKQAAGRGRLRAMVATGRAEEAVEAAKQLAEESEDPSVLIEAKFILAEAAFSELKTLVEENPRWQEDLFVRPEYHRLYNNALDLYLHPALFLGSETDAASRGLWGAVQVYKFGGDMPNAEETAQDIVMLYPETRFAGLGKKFLDGLPKDSGNKEEDDDED